MRPVGPPKAPLDRPMSPNRTYTPRCAPAVACRADLRYAERMPKRRRERFGARVSILSLDKAGLGEQAAKPGKIANRLTARRFWNRCPAWARSRALVDLVDQSQRRTSVRQCASACRSSPCLTTARLFMRDLPPAAGVDLRSMAQPGRRSRDAADKTVAATSPAAIEPNLKTSWCADLERARPPSRSREHARTTIAATIARNTTASVSFAAPAWCSSARHPTAARRAGPLEPLDRPSTTLSVRAKPRTSGDAASPVGFDNRRRPLPRPVAIG